MIQSTSQALYGAWTDTMRLTDKFTDLLVAQRYARSGRLSDPWFTDAYISH